MVTNADVVRTLERIADLLDIKGENPFKSRAYRAAAVQVENLGAPLAEIARRDGGLRDVEGFGKAIAEKVQELIDTGHLAYLKSLEAEIPPTLLAVTELSGVGPKTAALLWKEAGITSVEELEAAAARGGLDGLPRLGAKTIEKIKAALAHRQLHGSAARRPRDAVREVVEGVCATLRELPGAGRVEVAGSYRRGSATVGDVDIVVATHDQQAVLTAFAALPQVERVLLHGDTKCSVQVDGGFQIDCRAVPPESFGAALQYFTGSKQHNVRLRGRALRMGMTLNEYGLFRLDDQSRVAGRTEDEVYEALGVAWIPPEQRLDNGEIEASQIRPVPASALAVKEV